MKEIILTQKDMQNAVEHYLNIVIMKKPVKVTQVTLEKSGQLQAFTVSIAPPETKVGDIVV